MTQYADWTDEQKADFALYDVAIRGIVSTLGNAFKGANPDDLNQFSIDRVEPLVSVLDAAAALPNTSNLAGATDVTKEEFEAVQTLLRSVVSVYKNNRALLQKCAGLNVG